MSNLFRVSLLVLLTTVVLSPSPSAAIPGVDQGQVETSPELFDNKEYSFEELLQQAQQLWLVGRPIDARAKFQKALALRPNDFRPHMFLAQYYLFEVAHFRLAYRYIRTAERLFQQQHGTGTAIPLEQQRHHLLLLYLLSEAELNLDKYEDSLATLDKLKELYRPPDWYPGTRAWVLMKLKRVDEAVTVAQAGLMVGADPRRTWNILGILLSVKENRELSLNAFGEAIKAELTTQGFGHVATPLNNAGEVYREIFKDNFAEGSWRRAVRLPDGCEHILPSLNLAILYIDQLRLFQAERSLADFEACFAQQTERKDTEHRTLLALARGRIALHENRIEDALELLSVAEQDQQWFGKIGTNENDVEFASAIALAQALRSQAAVLRDTARDSVWERLQDKAMIPWLETRAWWLNRKARKIGLSELDDLEDLFIRNTDTMLEYPTFGTALADFDSKSFQKRIERVTKQDSRTDAHTYYNLYLGTNFLAHGDEDSAIPLLESALYNFRDIDRLARAETLAKLLLAYEADAGWLGGQSSAQQIRDLEYREELFSLLPSHLRYHNLSLPVSIRLEASGEAQKIVRNIRDELTKARFEVVRKSLKDRANYGLALAATPGKDDSSRTISVHLFNKKTNTQVLVHTSEVKLDGTGTADLVNTFIAKAFSHRADPPGQQLGPIPILDGIFKQ